MNNIKLYKILSHMLKLLLKIIYIFKKKKKILSLFIFLLNLINYSIIFYRIIIDFLNSSSNRC